MQAKGSRVSEAGQAAARAFREKLFREESEAFRRRVHELTELQRIGAGVVDGAKGPAPDVVTRVQVIGRKIAEARTPRGAKGDPRA